MDHIKSNIHKLIDKLLYVIEKRSNVSDEIKKNINSLTDSELLELINLYTSCREYEASSEKNPVPEFFLFRIQDYYEKQKLLWEQNQKKQSLPTIVLQFIKHQFELLQNPIPEFEFITEPFPIYRSGEVIQSKKINWVENIENSKKVEFSLIPQGNNFMLSVYFHNFQGSLTFKLKKENSIIDIKHFSNIKSQERIFVDELTFGEYYLYFKGIYNKEYYLNIKN